MYLVRLEQCEIRYQQRFTNLGHHTFVFNEQNGHWYKNITE